MKKAIWAVALIVLVILLVQYTGMEEEVEETEEGEVSGTTKVFFQFNNYVDKSIVSTKDIYIFDSILENLDNYQTETAKKVTTDTNGQSTQILTNGKHTVLPVDSSLAGAIVDSEGNVYYGYTMEVKSTATEEGGTMNAEFYVVDPVDTADAIAYSGKTQSEAVGGSGTGADHLILDKGTMYLLTSNETTNSGDLVASTVYQIYIAINLRDIASEAIVDGKLYYSPDDNFKDDMDYTINLISGPEKVTEENERVYFEGVYDWRDTPVVVLLTITTRSAIDEADTDTGSDLGDIVLQQCQGSPADSFKIELKESLSV